MELRESDKYIGKFVIVDLTPEAEKYISDVSVSYHPFGKIENHASMVDVPNIGKEKVVKHLEKLTEYGLSFSQTAEVAYERWKREAELERLATEHMDLARKINRIVMQGCAVCEEFVHYAIGKDGCGFCRHCDRELSGEGRFEMDYAAGMGAFHIKYIPEHDCKYMNEVPYERD